MKKGFTFVELSIVLVIVGLVIGGLLVGQSLVDSATTNKMVSQFDQYEAAIRTFKQKFKGLPGDIPNSRANFGTGLGGDGNNIIGGENAGGGTREQTLAWKHLQDAQMIPPPKSGGSYTGVLSARGDGIQYPVNICAPQTPYAKNIGVFISYYVSETGWGGQGYYGNYQYYGNRHHFLIYGETTNWVGQALSGKYAFELDKKMDDGIHTSGQIVKGAHGGCVSGANYNPSSTTPCYLSYFPDPGVFQ
jgi:prepilin-type N-terminal cleavage/methylation domain-containing protein